MPKIGCRYPCFSKILTTPADALPTYDTGICMGGLVSADLSIQLATGDEYADDAKTEHVSEFSSGTVTIENDDIEDSVATVVYGATLSDGELTFIDEMACPEGGLAYIQTKVKNGVKKYRARWYPRVRATLAGDKDQTKASNFTFANTSIPFEVMVCNSGAWRIEKEFTTESAAKAWIAGKLNVATYYRINVQANGAGSGQSVSVTGDSYVASAGSFSVTITGTPDAVYDNGADVTTSVVAGVYSLTNVSAHHNISVIF